MTSKKQTTNLSSLFERLQGGDPAARDELTVHVYDRLRKLTAIMLRDYPIVKRWNETDDIWQETCHKLYRALDEVKPRNLPELLGLAAKRIRWTLIDLSRKYRGPQGMATYNQSMVQPQALADEQSIDPPAETDGPETLAEFTEIHRLVDSLPDRERETFQLLYYNGLSLTETAELLGVNTRTVQRWMRSAKEMLYTKLHGVSDAGTDDSARAE